MTTTCNKRLSIDIETYCEADLKEVGVYRYAEDPSFEILLMAYAFDDAEVQIIDLKQGEHLPDEVLMALTNPLIKKAAYNANFERTCMQAALGVRLPPEEWECTKIRAATLGLPGSLDEVGKVLELEADKSKMRVGKTLIQFFCKPCKPTARNGGRKRNLPGHEPDRWELFKEYCKRDVEAEREIYNRLRVYPRTTNKEHLLWCLDQRMNEYGVLIKTKLVDNILDYTAHHQEALIERAQELTGLANPNSGKQSKEWLSQRGMEVESLNKESVSKLLKETDDDDILEYLAIKQQLGKTSISKYDAIRRSLCQDNRVRGILQFYGANRTGRWAGRIIQPQNLPKNTMRSLDLARELVLEGEFELLELLYPSIMQVFSELIRTAIIPPTDHIFIVADYSAIEARVIAWLADEKWRLDVFKTHGKIYEASAAQMFKVPIESITKGSPERAKGKVAELALGYQGSVGALKKMGAEAIGLFEDEMTLLVTHWRQANPKIVELWEQTENDIRDAILSPGQVIQGPKGVRYFMQLDTLFIRLPSGRSLAYKNADVRPGSYKREVVYQGLNQETKKWETVSSYGGKFVENITQAIARDCLAEALMKLEASGYLPTFHVHDEVVIEVPEGDKDRAFGEIRALMGAPIEWAEGLILTAEAFVTKYYMKD